MRHRFLALGLSMLLGLCLVGAIVWTTPVRANAPFTVDSTADEIDAAPGDGNCVSLPSSQCTLRAAIMEANALTGDDVINLPAGIYTLTLAGANEDVGLTGDLDITSTVTIEGAGATDTIVNGNGLDRVIHIAQSVTVTISNVTVTGGQSLSAGGGIHSSGSLILNDSIVSNNMAANGGGILSARWLTMTNSWVYGNNDIGGSGGGGGIMSGGSGLMVADSFMMDNNSATGGGGGVYIYDTLSVTIINTTIANNIGGGIFGPSSNGIWNIINSTFLTNTSNNGGGIAGSAAHLNIVGSTFSGNTALGGPYTGGGAIHFLGSLTIANSTFSSNSTKNSGGGIFIFSGYSSSVNLNNVTLFNNVADSDQDGVGDGGGIYSPDNNPASVQNSIISGNIDQSDQAPDCAGTLSSLGHNLIQDTTGCVISGTVTSVITGIDPLLGPLQDNGGPTFTHALLSGSPAIDAGNPMGCTDWLGTLLTTDQRGFARHVDGGSGLARCDIGAYEHAPLWLYLPFLRR